MTLPVSGQSLPGAYVYQYELGVTVGTLLGVDALQLITPANTGSTILFGTNPANGALTISYTDANGTPVTQDIDTTNDLQSPTAFSYTVAGVTYVVSNGPVTPSNIADVTVGTLTALIGGLGDVNLVQGATTYVACYAAGTLISTPTGKVAVETLSIGDLVLTASGQPMPVRWLGRRAYRGRFLKGHPDLLPILFRAGSLGIGIPSRDLRVSPRHAMFLDGVLVPAEALVNGATILQDEQVSEIHYIHVELDRHSVILAEDAPSETFVDDDSRMMFHNALDYRALYPDSAPVPVLYCAPRIAEGHRLERIRAALPSPIPAARAA